MEWTTIEIKVIFVFLFGKEGSVAMKKERCSSVLLHRCCTCTLQIPMDVGR